MKIYAKCLGAYLTGWLIVQPIYNRLHAAWRRRELRNPHGEMQEYYRQQARAFVDALTEYTPGHEPPAALDVITSQHDRITRLSEALDAAHAEVERLRRLVHEIGADRK